MFIYKITNIKNNKIYVGQTIQPLKTRFNRHMGYQKESKDTKFYRAVKKYGAKAFRIELVEEVESKDKLNEREEYWIRKLDAVNKGYNSYYGGFANGGDTLSCHPNLKEIKKKISNSKKGGKNPNSSKIKCINLETGESHPYNSLAECQEKMEIPRHDIISRRCRGIITKPYRNKFMFEYVVEGATTIESISKEKYLGE